MFENKRFDVIYTQKNFTENIQVIRDTETGVAYINIKNGYGGGICPLLNPDGSPMVYKDSISKEEK